MELLSHPFRLAPNGSIATVTDGSDAADAEGLAILALTFKGERVMVPTFGVTDPVADSLSAAELNVGLQDFGPSITVTGAVVTYPTNATQRVELSFDPKR